MVLIGAPGTLITKNEIVSRVWPDTVVAAENLKVQMSALRKVLNEDRDVIKTVHGRGYVFAGEVTTASVEPDTFARPGSEPTLPRSDLSSQPTRPPGARRASSGRPALG
jgi:DNA-binding winged helix-turn-helix (wHTH) protein